MRTALCNRIRNLVHRLVHSLIYSPSDHPTRNLRRNLTRTLTHLLSRTSAVAGLAVLAAACSTPAERAARMQAEMSQLIAIYGPACVQLGYEINSDPWRQCVLHLSTREELQRMGSNSGAYGGWGPGRWHGGAYWGPYW